MDHEHQICTDSFNRTLKDPSYENLQELYDIIKLHFDHEEELIKKYSNSDTANSKFSAVNSHMNDHKRILEIAKRELAQVSVAATATAKQVVCDKEGGT